MEGPFGHAVRRGVELALGRFVDALLTPAAAERGARDETYVELGRGEMRVGRSLDALLSAYRVGARVAWRRFVETGVEGGLPPATLYRLGEAIFAYIDAISAESAAGFAEEQSARAGERQRRRRALVRLLAAHPPADEESIRTAADAAGWPLPREVAAVVVVGAPEAEADEDAVRIARRIDPTAIGGVGDGAACVFVADPDAPGRRGRLGRVVDGRVAALGPTVGWAEAGLSAARAHSAARLAAAGGLPADGLVVAGDHLVMLALHANNGLASALAADALAPLLEVAEPARERLRETLRAWLDQPGQVQAVAAVLGVHPQTVRYRVRQLRELYGEELEAPERRLAIALALRAHPADPLSV
jgi:hypothetical protein